MSTSRRKRFRIRLFGNNDFKAAASPATTMDEQGVQDENACLCGMQMNGGSIPLRNGGFTNSPLTASASSSLVSSFIATSPPRQFIPRTMSSPAIGGHVQPSSPWTTADSLLAASSSSSAAAPAHKINSSPPCTGKNYMFHMNLVKIPSLNANEPKVSIDDIHKLWRRDYGLLEAHHSYIQWLFPLYESAGMSKHASRLEECESRSIIGNLDASVRLVKSYMLMLDFYGMRLVDFETGEIGCNLLNFEDRFMNLSTSSHNFLRITRILLSLGHLGFERYKLPWMQFVKLHLDGYLSNCVRSYNAYWIPACQPGVISVAAAAGSGRKSSVAAALPSFPSLDEESVFFTVMNDENAAWHDIYNDLIRFRDSMSF